jgi:hypothetical protein
LKVFYLSYERISKGIAIDEEREKEWQQQGVTQGNYPKVIWRPG